MTRRSVGRGVVLALISAVVAASGQGVYAADPPRAAGAGRRADQVALKAYGPFVGKWRGVGQVERGRTKGAWTESATWAWSLTQDSAALELAVARGKYLKSARLKPEPNPGSFRFEAILADGSKRAFSGKAVTDGPLVLTSEGPAQGVRRITLTPFHDTRLLVLYESEDADRGSFDRLGEVGYTREGVAFAAGDSYPVCIVTEGRGTIAVNHKGKTYHVCCSGCRDLFNENPEAILAEAEARRKEKASAAK